MAREQVVPEWTTAMGAPSITPDIMRGVQFDPTITAPVLTTTPWADTTWVNYTTSNAPANSYSASSLVSGGGGRQQ